MDTKQAEEFVQHLRRLYSGVKFPVNVWGVEGDCTMKVSQYAADSRVIALELFSQDDTGFWEPFCRLTVFLADPDTDKALAPLDGCVWFKTWSENEWVEAWADSQPEWFERTGRLAPAGYAFGVEYRLKDGKGGDAWPPPSPGQ